jgi:hypothetical protein
VTGRNALTGALVAAMLTATGCAGAERQAPQGAPAVSTMRIGLTEWSVVTPSVPVTPGEVSLEVTNAGATAHDLLVSGKRGTWRTPLLGPGEKSILIIDTVAGEMLHFDCAVAGHHSAGMHEQVRVAGRPSSFDSLLALRS